MIPQRIQSMPHLQEFVRSSLNLLADLMTVSRDIEEGPQSDYGLQDIRGHD